MSKYIKSSQDLETTYEAKRAGFLEIALRKSKEALPYIDEAKSLRASAGHYKQAKDLLKDKTLKGPLAEAAGVSTKASNYISSEDIEGIVKEFIASYLEPAGQGFIDELVYRFLLSKGDALGGRMRNIVGAIAGEKLTRFLSAQLRNSRVKHYFLLNGETTWKDSTRVTQDEIITCKSLRWWKSDSILRELTYNIKVPVVGQKGNNIDVSLFNTHTSDTRSRSATERKAFVSDPTNYIALGELKGGIDPAGADEHWKTANTALERIRTSFTAAGNPVKSFFVGGAIEASMAEEIYSQLRSNRLSAAANLTNENQLSDLCRWLVNL